MKVES